MPTLEIKKDFSGFFLDPLRIFRKRKGRPLELLEEKSVVRPTYSYMGKYTINDTTIKQIALYTARQVHGVGLGGRAFIENYTSGIILRLELTVKYGIPLKPVLLETQKKVVQVIEHMTAINVLKANIIAKHIYFEKGQ